MLISFFSLGPYREIWCKQYILHFKSFSNCYNHWDSFYSSMFFSLFFFLHFIFSVALVSFFGDCTRKLASKSSIAKKSSEGFEAPSGTPFLGGILFSTPDLASSLALSPGQVPWRLAQDF